MKIIFFLLLILNSLQVVANSCEAKVEHISTKLTDNGRKAFSNFYVGHNYGGRHLSTVSFDYAIHFSTNDGESFVENGFFYKTIHGKGKRYTEKYVLIFKANKILSVDIDDINCYDL